MNSAVDRLSVGYAKRDITPSIGASLAGRPMIVSRRARVIHDSLQARALHVVSGSTQITLLVADLLLITKGLQLEIARACNLDPEMLLVLATHTHSGPGGYWKGRQLESFMGPYREETRALLVGSLSETVRAAAESTSPADVYAASVDLPGMSTNRRQRDGAVDPVLTILKFDTQTGLPVCLVSFGAHPIVGLEREPFTMTADYPGEICRRLETLGFQSMFVQGACGGTSPALSHLPLEKHLQQYGDAFEGRIQDVVFKMKFQSVSRALIRQIPFPITTSPSRITPGGLPIWGALEDCVFPLKGYMAKLSKQGVAENQDASLSAVRFGSIVFLGIPGEVGPLLSLSLRKALANAGANYQMIASLCNGYVGYVHRNADYEYKRGIHILGLYENAMSLAGRSAGDSILTFVEQASEIFAVAP